MRAPLSLLLVDDQAANLLALEATLAPLGVTCVCAETGRRAIELAGGGHAAIVLDDHLPDLRGEEVARRIRDALGAACPPIILYTAGDADRAQRDAWQAAGVADVLGKAGDPAAVRAMIGAFVQRAREISSG